ncbi:hypothetical protein [Nocardioides sp. BYT-33-1]|uniref:hypothetical protein n=1 Tax=Nocardioides sp. BYT-33-1 TaxID=3416952 RepID=UPI003F53BBE1
MSAVVILAMLPGSAAPAAAPPAGASAPSSARLAAEVPLPAACRPNPGPPPTEYGFVARVTEGSVTGPGPLRIVDVDVSVCGVIRLVNAQPGSGCTGIQAQLVIPAEGVVTNGLNASLAIAGAPVIDNVPTKVNAAPMSSDVACGDSVGGLKMDLSLKVDGSAGVFGLQCRVPLTGRVHATVSGALLSPPYRGQATIKGAVEVGAVSNHDEFCPGRLPRRLNGLVGLPASGYQVDWPAEVSVYQPS